MKENGEVEMYATHLDATYQYARVEVGTTTDGFVLVSSTGSQSTLVKMLSSGALDTSFGEGGIVRIADGCGRTTNDGAMLLVTCASALRRFDQHGALDATIPNQISASQTIVTPDGRYLVGGRNAKGAAVAMCTRDGALDPSFGEGGVAAADPNLTTPYPSAVVDVAIAPDGKVLVRGRLGPFECCDVWFYLRRLDANGSTDTSFATNDVLGEFFTDAFALQSDGRILVAGSPGSGGGPFGVVARYWN